MIEKVFAEYDTDNNGSLDAAELGLFARKLDPKASADEVNTLLAKLFRVDKNGDGLVSESEWEKAFGRESNLYPPLRPFAQIAKGKDRVTLEDFLELVGPHSMLSDRVARAVGVM